MVMVSSTYHTDSDEYPPEHRSVYHEHRDCPVGKLIPPSLKMAGTGGKEKCAECVKRDHPSEPFAPVSFRPGKVRVSIARLS